MKVIGTAGHIDHGKSTLVQALTGMDPDRLEEEHRRGMTIDLGFVWLTLPSGREVSVIDVPGHERFVKNMLAGVGGIDVALLVVAADESVMPQTKEHLDILDLLNVRHGIVALTKVDLVDDDWAALVREEIAEVLSGTTLARVEIVPVSAVSGDGLNRLLLSLDAAIERAPERVDLGLPYLPIDRVFTRSGFGTVVTGTLHDGSVHNGDEMEVVPSRLRTRVRGMQSHREAIDEATPGMRVAVNLAGVRREALARGDVLCMPGTIPSVSAFDAHIEVLHGEGANLRHGAAVTLHVGAAERGAKVRLLDSDTIEPGKSGWAQIRLSKPVALVRRQRFILRLPAPAGTVAGGEVVDVKPRSRRYDVARLDRLHALRSPEPESALAAVLPDDRPRSAENLAARLTISPTTARAKLIELVHGGTAIAVGTGYMTTSGWLSVRQRIVDLVATYHLYNPTRSGMPREELRHRLHWDQLSWNAVLASMAGDGLICEESSIVRLTSHAGGSAARSGEAQRVIEVLSASPFAPPPLSALIQTTGTDLALLKAMSEEGTIVQVAPDLFFAREAYDAMQSVVVASLRGSDGLTVAELRDILGTSRRFVLSLLEHLDAQRITRRTGDKRQLGARAPTCA